VTHATRAHSEPRTTLHPFTRLAIAAYHPACQHGPGAGSASSLTGQDEESAPYGAIRPHPPSAPPCAPRGSG
jgi:hypothetical protein